MVEELSEMQTRGYPDIIQSGTSKRLTPDSYYHAEAK